MYRVAQKVSDFFNTSYYLEPFKIIFFGIIKLNLLDKELFNSYIKITT